jgi:transposase-like protein
MAEEKQCVLALIGADEWGRKEIVGLADGYRESTQSWRERLLDLQRRGLSHALDLAVGDGALGFWHALREVFGATKEQRCWLGVSETLCMRLSPRGFDGSSVEPFWV